MLATSQPLLPRSLRESPTSLRHFRAGRGARISEPCLGRASNLRAAPEQRPSHRRHTNTERTSGPPRPFHAPASGTQPERRSDPAHPRPGTAIPCGPSERQPQRQAGRQSVTWANPRRANSRAASTTENASQERAGNAQTSSITLDGFSQKPRVREPP